VTVQWGGPFAGLAGGGFAGWSNQATGAGTLHTRYRDGDPQSSFAWREMAGNVNYQLATSRRLIWADTFHSATAADPSKSYTGTDWTALDAVYAIAGPFVLTPNARRGQGAPPRLSCRVRARTTAGADTHHVRIYAVGTLAGCARDWERQAGQGADGQGYRDFSVASATYPASPGWSSAAELVVPHDDVGLHCSPATWAHPASTALSGIGIDGADVDVLLTYLVLAAIGDGVDGTYVAAVQVHEEAPGA
jgi:hypothetical protein